MDGAFIRIFFVSERVLAAGDDKLISRSCFVPRDFPSSSFKLRPSSNIGTCERRSVHHGMALIPASEHVKLPQG